LVCVVVGAPGPVHGAAAAGVSAAAPSMAVATVPEKYETSFLYLFMSDILPREGRLSTRPAFSLRSIEH
jgi:hypothetical protein